MAVPTDSSDHRMEDREARIAKERCADFILRMIEKYGREVLEEQDKTTGKT